VVSRFLQRDDWKPQWSHDDEYCIRVVTNNIHVFKGKSFDSNKMESIFVEKIEAASLFPVSWRSFFCSLHFSFFSSPNGSFFWLLHDRNRPTPLLPLFLRRKTCLPPSAFLSWATPRRLLPRNHASGRGRSRSTGALTARQLWPTPMTAESTICT